MLPADPSMRPYYPIDWIGRTLDEEPLARVSASDEYVIRQLRDGLVILIVANPSPRDGDPWTYVVGDPLPYSDALRKLADIVDSL